MNQHLIIKDYSVEILKNKQPCPFDQILKKFYVPVWSVYLSRLSHSTM
jgi:hypothetical protein